MKTKQTPKLPSEKDFEKVEKLLTEIGIDDAVIITPHFSTFMCDSEDKAKALIARCMQCDKLMRMLVINALANMLLGDIDESEEVANSKPSLNNSNKNLN
jgi:hypothetical protein